MENMNRKTNIFGNITLQIWLFIAFSNLKSITVADNSTPKTVEIYSVIFQTLVLYENSQSLQDKTDSMYMTSQISRLCTSIS